MGNPGARYEGTRHNVGFEVIDLLAKRYAIKLKKLKFQSLYTEHEGIIFLKPQTFMNLSGQAVRQCAGFYRIPPERIVIIVDDISLPPGKLRIRQSGSDGGHNGLKDILYHLASDQFPRIRIGVGAKPRADMDLADWVLSSFSSSERDVCQNAFIQAADAAEHIIRHGVQSAMNHFNAQCQQVTKPVHKKDSEQAERPDGALP